MWWCRLTTLAYKKIQVRIQILIFFYAILFSSTLLDYFGRYFDLRPLIVNNFEHLESFPKFLLELDSFCFQKHVLESFLPSFSIPSPRYILSISFESRWRINLFPKPQTTFYMKFRQCFTNYKIFPVGSHMRCCQEDWRTKHVHAWDVDFEPWLWVAYASDRSRWSESDLWDHFKQQLHIINFINTLMRNYLFVGVMRQCHEDRLKRHMCATHLPELFVRPTCRKPLVRRPIPRIYAILLLKFSVYCCLYCVTIEKMLRLRPK